MTIVSDPEDAKEVVMMKTMNSMRTSKVRRVKM